jgi:hypothetical protein
MPMLRARLQSSVTLGRSLLAASLIYGCCTAAAQAQDRQQTSVHAPRGYYALQPGDPAVLSSGSKRLVSDEQLQLPQVAGLTIRARWAWVHPSEGNFDFAFIDSQVERCRRLGKQYKLLVMTGAECSPKWIGGAWHRRAPAPWSPELAKHYGALVAELGKRYAGDPLLAGVHITGPTFPSAEMHPAPGIENVAGYSAGVMINAWAASIDAYAAAFPETACILSISVRPPTVQYLGQVVEHGRTTLGTRFTLEHNALKASTHPLAPHHVFIASQAKLGVRVGFEMVCAAANNPGRFGSRDVMAGIALGASAGGVYFDVYPPDLAALR